MLAGVIGIDPGPYTLAQLVEMAEARQRAFWAPFSEFMANFANSKRDPAKRRKPFRANDFSPFAERPKRRRKKQGVPAGIEVLKCLVDNPSLAGNK